MDDTTLVGQGHVRAYEDVVGDGLAEDFDSKDISDYFFGFALEIGVDEGNMVV
jgi:hypothetical protein